MIEINWNPDRRQMTAFAALCVVALAGLGFYRAWREGLFVASVSMGWQGPWLLPVIFWTVGAMVGLLGLLAPQALRPLYVGWMAVVFPISWTVSHALLAATYFGLFTIFAVVFRLMGRDELRRGFDRSAASYWQDREPDIDIARYFKQF